MEKILQQLKNSTEWTYVEECADPDFWYVFQGGKVWWFASEPFTLTYDGRFQGRPSCLTEPLIVSTDSERVDDLKAVMIRRKANHAWFVSLPTLADPLPDPPHPVTALDFFGKLSDAIKLGIQHAIVRYRGVRGCSYWMLMDGCSRSDEYQELFVNTSHIKMPLHLADNYDLVKRSINGQLCTVFPHYTNAFYVHAPCPIFGVGYGSELDKWQRAPSRSNGIMPSAVIALYDHYGVSREKLFARWPSLAEAPLLPTKVVTHQYSTYIVLELDLDKIQDDLDTNGWTPIMTAFAREQLKIDHLHDGAFRKFLTLRKDTPRAILC